MWISIREKNVYNRYVKLITKLDYRQLPGWDPSVRGEVLPETPYYCSSSALYPKKSAGVLYHDQINHSMPHVEQDRGQQDSDI